MKNMSEKPQIDIAKFSDFEISMLIIERDSAQFKAERIDELLNKYGRAKGLVDAKKEKQPTSYVNETTFNILKFEPQKGERLGDFEVASKPSNVVDKFSQAYGILRANNATIKERYHGPGYGYGYWIWEGKIFRKSLKKNASKTTSVSDTSKVEQVKQLFPKDLEDMLLFEEKEEYVVIRPRQYLGSDNFAKIAAIVREASGEYISVGKDSHFRVPKAK